VELTHCYSKDRIDLEEECNKETRVPMQAELIYNPSGGQVVVRQELNNVLAFLNRQGWVVTLQETSEPLEATELARRAVAGGARVVIAAGGDGTINEVANGLIGSDAALGVLPVGTTNSWALQMGIPALSPMLPGTQAVKMVAAVEEILARPLPFSYHQKVLLNAARVLVEGKTVLVDVGQLNGRYFLMWAGIGFDAAIAQSVTLAEKRLLGSWAYVLPAIEALPQYAGTEVSLSLDGKTVKVNTPLIVVSNIQLYGGMLAIGAKACVNDGRLDVCIFKGGGFFTFVQQAAKLLARRHLQDPQVEYYQCREMVIEAARALPVHVDGEPFTSTPVTIRVAPSSLKAVVPRNLPPNLFAS